MAASFQTGTTTGPTDLLQKIETWLTAQGWTLDQSAVVGAGRRLHMHKNGVYVNMRSVVNENMSAVWGYGSSAGYGIGLYIGNGYSGAANWNAQAGGPTYNSGSEIVGASCNVANGTSTYWLLDDGSDNVHISVKSPSGIWSHLGWGQMEKLGAWTGGSYFYANVSGSYIGIGSTPGFDSNANCPFAFCGGYSTTSCGFVRCDVDAFTGKWICAGSATGSNTFAWTGKMAPSSVGVSQAVADIPMYGVSGNFAANQSYGHRGVSNIGSQINVKPILVWATRDAGGYSPIGKIPNVFAIPVAPQGWEYGDVVTLGGVDYFAAPNHFVRKWA